MNDSPKDTETRDPEAGGEAITAEGIAALRSEVEQLEGPARRQMAERIKTARELGDLKENADYHLAKEDQAHLETRIKRLRARLQMAEVVEVDESSESFAFGQTAEVVDDACAILVDALRDAGAGQPAGAGSSV